MQLSGSRVFSETFRVVKERFGPLLGIWATYTGIMLFLMVVGVAAFASTLMAGFAGMVGADPQASPFSGIGAGMIAAIFVFYVALITLIMAQYGSLCALASPLQQRSFSDALKDGLRSIPTLLGVALLMIVAYLVCALVVGLIGAGLIAALGSVGAFVVGLLVIAGLFYVGCRLSVLLPVTVVERIGNPITVISRTWALTSGNVFKIFLINLVMVVLAFIVFGVSYAPMMGAMTEAQAGGGMPNFAGLGVSFVLQILAGIVMAVFGSALQAAIHAELAGDSGHNLDDTFA